MLYLRTHQPTNSIHLSDGTRHGTNSYYDGTWEATNCLWPSKQHEFRIESNGAVDADESGICSPPLWKTSPPTSPKDEGNNDYRSLSPKSRTQAIVKGQNELMEMVKNMPDSNFELSLKDLVEHHHQRVDPRQDKKLEEKKSGGGGGSGSGRRVVVVDKMGSVKRKNGLKVDHGGGFYLKMVFPFTLGSKDKKHVMKMNMNETNSKVSPKPSSGSEKEWWKKSPSASKESDSGVSSINSGSMKSSYGSSSSSKNSNSSRHEKSGGRCWYFIRRPKSQTKK